MKLCALVCSYALCGDMLTTAYGLHAAHSALLCQVSMVVVHASSHVVATKFAYSYSRSPGFMGKRTTQVAALYQTLPLFVKGLARETRSWCWYGQGVRIT